MEPTVYIVHCVDTEGPLYEDLGAKFQRLESIFGISQIQPTQENFEKICRGELDLGGKEDIVKNVFSSHLSKYMENWQVLDEMLSRAMSSEFRGKLTDSWGQPYIYSWFCVDHVNYLVNPRRRTLGYHAIFDHYKNLIESQPGNQDGLHWHFHQMSTYKEAHRCATSVLNSPHIIETLARRIIERDWFPSCCRSGFQTERPDSHWFLEQYIPFDFTNTSITDLTEVELQDDLSHGRFGDWRLAPKDWKVYHPSHDNYQLQGDCRRWIARSLNILNRFGNMDLNEIRIAFDQAKKGLRPILSVASHDYRDLTVEVDHFRGMLLDVMSQNPNVKIKFCEARQAFREVIGPDMDAISELKLKLNLKNDAFGKPAILEIETQEGKVFGPQPFLAIKTRSQRFIHDNLDFSMNLKSWRYVFDNETILPDDVSDIGIGASDAFGNTFVEVIHV